MKTSIRNDSLYKKQIFKGERPLFKTRNLFFSNCDFQEGESALKECMDISVNRCRFWGKYPLWHNRGVKIKDCVFNEECRAAVWYSDRVSINNCTINAPKFLRDSKAVCLRNTRINGAEILWHCKDVNIFDTSIDSDYLLYFSRNIEIKNLTLTGNYSFQNTENVVLKNCKLDSKDTFWNSNNVTVYDSELKGAYLGWYSKNLTLINCVIKGIQPLCYAENLVMKNCEMVDADLCFEYSDLDAEIIGTINSVKNPVNGKIIAEKINKIILDDPDIDESNIKILSPIESSIKGD